MQPYLFPYIGYFQLVAAVDRFVFYDDVQFIQQGWINRNRLTHGTFTVPLARSSHRATIQERRIDRRQLDRLRPKWMRGFRQQYGKAPYFDATARLFESVLSMPTDSIAELAMHSVLETARYLGLAATFEPASRLRYDRAPGGSRRLLQLLHTTGAHVYVNAVGGKELYRAADFAEQGIELRFLQTQPALFAAHPGARLSILHLVALHSPQVLREQWLSAYHLV